MYHPYTPSIQSDQRFESGSPVKSWAILQNREVVFIDRQDGDGEKAWFFSGQRKIAPEDIKEWCE